MSRMFKIVTVTDRRSQVAAQARDGLADALEDVAEDCLFEANRTIPIEEGVMQDSGFAEVDREALEGQVAYDTPYTVKQHEDPDLHHDEGRRAKWLEATVAEQGDRWKAYIARLLSGRLR